MAQLLVLEDTSPPPVQCGQQELEARSQEGAKGENGLLDPKAEDTHDGMGFSRRPGGRVLLRELQGKPVQGRAGGDARTLSAAIYPLQTLRPPPLSSPCPSEAIRVHHALPHIVVSCTQSPNLVPSRCGLQLPPPCASSEPPIHVIIAFSTVTGSWPSLPPHPCRFHAAS